MENKFKVTDGVFAKIIPAQYMSGNRAFQLIVSESNNDDYFVGEPWSSVSVNLFGLAGNEMALDNDFSTWCDVELVSDVLEYLTEDGIPTRYIPSGFVNFPVYKLKDGVLDDIIDAEEG